MTTQKRFFVSVRAMALLGGCLVLGSTKLLALKKNQEAVCQTAEDNQPVQKVSLEAVSGQVLSSTPDFVDAARIATPTVVHIRATYEARVTSAPGVTPFDRLFKEFFGEEFYANPREHKTQPQQATGSGVIVTADGYIVTNNHVIDGADRLEITLDDNRNYMAQLVGCDPDTDLALLKIEEKGLPYLLFGDSDALQVGEWVLAVGNPFNLNSTVTKGIVSAKARNINILQNRDQGREKMQIESFIQTDAAVNRGNSGGALVNLRGELVGINTAIASPNPSGTFAGYSFAIPASIVKKTAEDLKRYGAVQRAILGIVIRNVDADLAKEKELKKLSGVYVAEVKKKGAAAEAGINPGDLIVAVDGGSVKNTAQLQEQIALHKPGDKVRITFYRGAQEKTVVVALKRMESAVQIVHRKDVAEVAGSTFENVGKQLDKDVSQFTGGVRLKILKEGPWKQAGVKQGFIVTAVDREPVGYLDQFVNVLKRKTGGVLVEGFYQSGEKVYYGVDLGSGQ